MARRVESTEQVGSTATRFVMPASSVWLGCLDHITRNGDSISPRGMNTKEILGFQSCFDMQYPIITIPERRLGYKFMAAEAAWILSGDNRVSSISPFSRDISKFSDDGVTFFGAYGPRVVDQLSYVVKALAADQNTRQAVMTIWRPNPGPTKDVPCTVAIQWFIRNGELHCIDTMRSSDIWLGWPYDVFNFTMLSCAIILRLRNVYGINVTLGSMTLFAGSQHLYEKNWHEADKVLKKWDPEEGPRINPHIWQSEDELVNRLWELATLDNGILDL